jgi:3-methyladenine DNA glycosylase AlkD
MATKLARTLLAELRRAADPSRAPQMAAYMKSAMPYLGVSAVPLRAACRAVFADVPLPSADAWRSLVLTLWRGARFREERYAAIELSGSARARAFQTLDALPMYEEMIVDGAWWDYVDVLAAHRLGPILRRSPREMRASMLAWSRCDHLWKRRAAILCQLRFKADTDLALLYACIEPSIGSGEFFLRKGIGWALRQHAWTDPREVLRYVKENRARLSPLTKREALKNVIKQGIAADVP